MIERNPKSETRMTNQIRNQNDETAFVSGFSHSGLIRHSDFGFSEASFQ